jgi:glycerol-3-phosphate dehydrogenase (NAD(P)+)
MHYSVLGAGSWGTALAIRLAQNGHEVTLWTHRAEQAATLQSERRNARYLPDATFPDGLQITSELHEAGNADRVLLAIPSAAFADTLAALKSHLKNETPVLWATKGFAQGGRLLHEIVAEHLPTTQPRGALSGPTFAAEVARGLPTAITLALDHTLATPNTEALAQTLAQEFHSPTFRCYTNPDLIGVEIGGAIKNVLAIAAGIADGLGFGANARTALITRGLAEMMRLGAALGAKAETFMGLAGLGDLVLTCTDDQSRNRRFGLALGRGDNAMDAKASIDQVIEGAETAQQAWQLAQQHGVEMPITEQVVRVIAGEITPRDAVAALLQRDPKSETTGA